MSGENGHFLFPEIFDSEFEARLGSGHEDVKLDLVGHAGLVPYQQTIFPKTGRPYVATRWRKPQDEASPIHVVPAAMYQGNLMEVFEAWRTFLSTIGEMNDDLLVPIVALQEILYKGHAGILAIQDNRIIGVASVQTGKDLVSASPIDRMRSKKRHLIEGTLRQGLRAYEMV